MKKIKFLILLILSVSLLIIVSCDKEAEPCADVECQNDGSCVDGICDCPVGYMGTNCENFDFSQVQALLDSGYTPIDIVNGGVPLDSLYGKMYLGGLIFYLNTDNGTGLIAATEDQSPETGSLWGCQYVDIMDLNNVEECAGMGDCEQPLPLDTYEGAMIGDGQANTDAILAEECTSEFEAANLCRNIGDEWFLPSRAELNLMYINLHSKGQGDFVAEYYWSSTEYHAAFLAWIHNFDTGKQGVTERAYFASHVRAARTF